MNEAVKVKIIVYPTKEEQSSEYMKYYFSKRYCSCVWTSFNCPCCNRNIVLIKGDYDDNYRRRHLKMIGVKVQSEKEVGILVLCEECYKKGISGELLEIQENTMI